MAFGWRPSPQVWVQSKLSGYYLALLSDSDGTGPAIDNPGAVSAHAAAAAASAPVGRRRPTGIPAARARARCVGAPPVR